MSETILFASGKGGVGKSTLCLHLAASLARRARRVLVVASGADKADAVYNVVCGPIAPSCPGSILQLHKDVVLVADEAALSKLTAAGVAL